MQKDIRKSPLEIIPSIINSMKQGGQTLTQLSKSSGINRITLSQYITAFEKAGLIRSRKSGREKVVHLISNPNSYFDLPINVEDNNKLITYYHHIKEECKKIHNKEPSKTQVYKIVWELNKSQEHKLPIGWYLHGPCSVRIYRGNEQKLIELDKEELSKLKDLVKEYCKMDNLELQKLIYKKEKSELYLLKEEFLTRENISKDELNQLFIRLIKLIPKEAGNTCSDFMGFALMFGWKESKSYFFDYFWKYLATVMFKESLKEYYKQDNNLSIRIEELETELLHIISQKVQNYMKVKYEKDEVYQSWKKTRSLNPDL